MWVLCFQGVRHWIVLGFKAGIHLFPAPSAGQTITQLHNCSSPASSCAVRFSDGFLFLFQETRTRAHAHSESHVVTPKDQVAQDVLSFKFTSGLHICHFSPFSLPSELLLQEYKLFPRRNPKTFALLPEKCLLTASQRVLGTRK